ncbi:hypothetical protein, partial [uncultured Alistipes sp.]|uniref:hypothetical protein n=1 Tax=uncultured Alistipes sp. TaxID=538949 RepID=UPI0026168336
SKCGVRATVPGVRIPLSPPKTAKGRDESCKIRILQDFSFYPLFFLPHAAATIGRNLYPRNRGFFTKNGIIFRKNKHLRQ